MKLLKGYTKEEKSWMMYDWANSAYSVVIVTILPIFYNTVAGFMENASSGLATWGFVTSAAMAIVAVSAPLLGALGDYKDMRKKLFFVFMLLGALSCLFIACTPNMDFTSPGKAEKVGMMILLFYVLATVGFAGGNIYYDGFLNDVTTDERMDRVSTMGFGLGYIGGSTIPLLVFLLMNLILGPDSMLFCLSFAFGLTGLWWLVFSIPLLKNVRQKTFVERKKGDIKKVFRELKSTAVEIYKYKGMFVFLVAYFFYIDGVNTIIHLSTSYGDTLGLGATGMLLALLLLQVLGLPFCLLYIKLSEKYGPGRMIGVAIVIYCGVTVFAFFLKEIWQFWVMALIIATSQGGIQALSRSMFGKMIPDKNRTGEFFGFYDIFGRFSAIMGPALVGTTTSLASSCIFKQRGIVKDMADAAVVEEINQAAAPFGIVSLLLIFFTGGILYFFVLPRYISKDKK